MSRRVRVVGLALLAGVGTASAASCGDPVSDAILRELAEPCLHDSDCLATPLAPEHPDAKAVCVFGRCHVECEVTEDCRKFGLGEDIRCVIGDKPTNVCQLADEVACTVDATKTPAEFSNASCPVHEKCGADGECRDKCAAASECVSGQQCVQGTCADEDELVDGALTTVTPCAYSSDCLGALVCRDHVCDEECKSTKDCVAPATCVETTNADNGTVHVCQSPTGPTMKPAHCSNKVKDEDESAIDCGGADCFGCEGGTPCTAASDCVSAICDDQICTHANCTDLTHNGTETGQDCGGPECPPCAGQQPCTQPTDCQGGLLCVAQLCVPPTCVDQAQNGAETGIDCGGGTCPGCDAGGPCAIPGDCKTSVCTAGVCAMPTCNDGVKNGLETGTDCGGGPASTCPACGVGSPCMVGTDCASGACSPMTMTCGAPGCGDGISNGFETGVDCGGGAASGCPACGAGQPCGDDADCASGTACNPLMKCANTVTLHVVKAGNGSGTVTSTDGAISCGTACDAIYFMGDNVVLNATPSGPASFSGWSGGACSTNPCTPALNLASVTVTATFTSPVTAWQHQTNSGTFVSAAMDAQSNTYFCGTTNGGAYGSNVLDQISGSEALIGKIDPSGTYGWVRNFASNGTSHRCDRVVALPGGDVIAVVRDNGEILYGATAAGCAANSQNAMSLVRLTGSAGNVVWANCHAQGITVSDAILDDNGKLVVVGQFSDSVDLGGTVLTAASNPDGFIARYEPSTGALLGARRLGNGGFDRVSTMSKIPGGFLVSGDCYGDVTFVGSPTNAATSNLQGGLSDMCLVKLNLAFDAQWARAWGVSNYDFGGAAGLLPDGTIAVAGTFFGNSVDFGDGVFRDADGSADVVLMRLDGLTGALSGTTPNVVTYPTVAGGNGPAARVSGLVVDSTGRIHLAGYDVEGVTEATYEFAGTQIKEAYLLTTTTANFGVPTALHGGVPGAYNYPFELIRQLTLGPLDAVVITGETFPGVYDVWGLGPLSEQHHIARFVP